MIRAVKTAHNATRITGWAFLIESCQLLATTGSPTSSAKRLLVRANQPRTPGSAMNMGMRMEAKPRRTKASPTENIFPAMSSYTAKVTPGEIPEPMAAGNTRRSPTVCVDLGVQCSDNAHRDAGTQLDFRRGPSQCRNGHPRHSNDPAGSVTCANRRLATGPHVGCGMGRRDSAGASLLVGTG